MAVQAVKLFPAPATALAVAVAGAGMVVASAGYVYLDDPVEAMMRGATLALSGGPRPTLR